MRVLVTGHNGYVGSLMVPILVEAGHEVVGLDTDLYAGSTFEVDQPQVHIPEIKKDIRDIERKDLEGYHAIIHLAGLSNDPLGDLNPTLTDEINFRASYQMAALAKEVGVERFIFSSSCSNYGAGGLEWLNEESPFSPVTPYGISKVRVEQEVSRMADDTFSPTFLRSATAYGVSRRLRFDLVLNNLTAWAFTTGQVYLKSDGTAWRPLVHIEDMSRAFLAVLQAPREIIHNQAFNVGQSDENYTIREVATIVAETVPGSEVRFAQGAGADTRCYRVDCSKIANLLPEFQPRWNIRKGVKELYETYQQVGLQLEDFEGPRFRRITHIKELISSGRLDENLRWTETETMLEKA